MMVHDNTFIHGRTVADWKQLANRHNCTHGTAEALAHFIDSYRKVEREADQKDFFNPARSQDRRFPIEDMERELKELLNTWSAELADKKKTMNAAQIAFLESELPAWEQQVVDLCFMRPKTVKS